jgi:molybdopterin molybdotransferase
MISVEEAKRILLEHVRPMPFLPVPLHESEGCVLVQDIVATNPHPLFDMSAVDGYAVSGNGPEWRVIGSIAAGGVHDRELGAGECVRIFTGAQVPAGTHAVVMQERCSRDGDLIKVTIEAPAARANIRRRGEQFDTGDLLLRLGDRMNAPAIGLVASAGVEEVEVAFKPWVSIIRTGGEFIQDGLDRTGRIFSSNDAMLMAALLAEGCEVDEEGAYIAEDDDAELTNVLEEASEADVIITTGGVSVGDHDRVAAVLTKLGATIHFHGVAQKPGKPMLFATYKDKPVFGLPGNPRAVMVLFWEYVLPFLRASQGASDPWLRSDKVPLAQALVVKGDRAEFRAARMTGGHVQLLTDEGSHMLRSLVDADALVYIPADRREWNEGATIDVHYLPR